jgi:hypothetical protein
MGLAENRAEEALPVSPEGPVADSVALHERLQDPLDLDG